MSSNRRGGFYCSQISREFQTKEQRVAALERVSFHVPSEMFLCIVGPSGCGKSTLLRIIAGLLLPTDGDLRFDGFAEGERPRTSMVFQEQGLFPWMTVVDNVAFGLEAQGMGNRERRGLAEDFLHRVGLTGFTRSYPHQLSGGMRQRAAIARAFLTNPDILLMDEPFAALDAQTRIILQEELLEIWKEQRKTVIYVTHDIEEAIMLGDRILVMTGRPGRIRADITIPLARPRALTMIDDPEVKEIKWHIWKMLEDEVRMGLSQPAAVAPSVR